MAARGYLLTICVVLAMVCLTKSDLLPYPGCFILELSFKSLGCADGVPTSDYCNMMAFVFRLRLDSGEGLCSAVPCVGYDQRGKRCTSLFPRACSSGDRIYDGLCPMGMECCED